MVTKEGIQRSINRAKQELKRLQERKEDLSKYGYEEMGYFKGRLAVLEDWLDEMEEEE